jgi:hypothetical protein
MISNSYLQPSASTVAVTILTDVAAVSGKSLDLAQLVEHTTVTVHSHCMVAGSIPAVER